MKKTALILFISTILINFHLFAQSNEYSFMTTADLQNKKTEVVKSADYASAAKIQAELDLRTTEAKSLAELKKKLDAAVTNQDFAKAAKIQEEMKILNEKNDLRLKIEEALKKDEYGKAAVHKESLRVLIDGDSPVLEKPTVPAQDNRPQLTSPTPPVSQTSPPNAGSSFANTNTHTSRNFSAWSCGMNAPFGFMTGSLNISGVGFYMNYRNNLHAFEIVDQKMIEGVIDNSSWIYDYNGISRYSRLELNLGLTEHIAGDLNEFGLFAYTGIGFTRFRYLYEFDEFGPSTGTNFGTRIINDESFSGWNFNIEGGFIFNFNNFNIHTGIVTGLPSLGQSMFVIGLGYTTK